MLAKLISCSLSPGANTVYFTIMSEQAKLPLPCSSNLTSFCPILSPSVFIIIFVLLSLGTFFILLEKRERKSIINIVKSKIWKEYYLY